MEASGQVGREEDYYPEGPRWQHHLVGRASLPQRHLFRLNILANCTYTWCVLQCLTFYLGYLGGLSKTLV